MSVGHGVNLLLNITPDDHGEIPQMQVRRLKEFGADIAARFAKPLFTTKGKGNSLSIDFGGEKSVDHIILREDIRMGERCVASPSKADSPMEDGRPWCAARRSATARSCRFARRP